MNTLDYLQSAIAKYQQRKAPVVRIKPIGREKGCVVISYISWPFIHGLDPVIMRGHTNAFEVKAMADSYVRLGFRVEIIDYHNKSYTPPRDAVVAIDLHGSLEGWEKALPDNCKRVLHATGPHWLQWNRSELLRLEGVRNRKGLAISPRRQVEPSRSAELTDHITVLGNNYTMDSFVFAGKPITRVPISSAYEFNFDPGKDYEKARRKFLWVGSYGMVMKGLDLVLDAFAQMPDLELTVCGSCEKEADFFRVYEKELRHTPNIRFHGWIDMGDMNFHEIVRTHGAIIYPSAAEGGAGSVIHCIHAGLIPICTTEASVDLVDFGIQIEDGTVEACKNAARKAAGLSSTEFADRALAGWEHVKNVHTREEFARNYMQFAESLMQ